MAMTKKQEEEIKEAMKQEPPKKYNRNAYPFNITGCPGYEGYIPENLGHEVCKHCGTISYYH